MTRFEPSTYELVGLPSGSVLRTHATHQCMGRFCTIHNPSGHHMREWPIAFNEGHQWLALRTCPHDKLHPDPDSLAHYTEIGMRHVGEHECDGCCDPDKIRPPRLRISPPAALAANRAYQAGESGEGCAQAAAPFIRAQAIRGVAARIEQWALHDNQKGTPRSPEEVMQALRSWADDEEGR